MEYIKVFTVANTYNGEPDGHVDIQVYEGHLGFYVRVAIFDEDGEYFDMGIPIMIFKTLEKAMSYAEKEFSAYNQYSA